MESSSLTAARDFLFESRRVLDACLIDDKIPHLLVTLAEVISASLRQGGKLLLAGNGGSAADAQHIAGEFLSRLNYDRAPLAAIALTTDTSVLTAVGNDYGFPEIFSRQILGLGRKGDVLIGISTSGRSPNILKGLEAARRSEIITIGFTGQGAREMDPLCDYALKAPTDSTPLMQQIHITAAHIVCGLVESALFPTWKAEQA